ncbi:hypothetical protein, partial [Methylocella tundrae]|uniref:hypothetical protein n=2 Tax=Pseudomonadota TaxID=1224 RepID=UPI001AEEF530
VHFGGLGGHEEVDGRLFHEAKAGSGAEKQCTGTCRAQTMRDGPGARSVTLGKRPWPGCGTAP